MRRGNFSAASETGGGRRAESSQPGTESSGSGTDTADEAEATRGVTWVRAFAIKKWFVPGTVFLQQPSAFAVGAHWPLRQHRIASGVRTLARQSNGWASKRMASKLTTI